MILKKIIIHPYNYAANSGPTYKVTVLLFHLQQVDLEFHVPDRIRDASLHLHFL